MYFQVLQERLIDTVRERIRAGVFTERKLARICGISQPHMHNMLKRIRSPSNATADRLLQALGLRIPDLLWRTSTAGDYGVQAVPLVRSRIGPGFDGGLENTRGFVPLPEPLVRGLVDPVAARVGPDMVLPGAVCPQDVVLLDQNPEIRARPSLESLWVVAEGSGLRVRYVRSAGEQLYVLNELTLRNSRQWKPVTVHRRGIAEIVRARIVWLSRELRVQSD